MKAIDVWCVACMGFLFAAVVEVIILHLLRTKYTQHSTSTFHQMVSTNHLINNHTDFLSSISTQGYYKCTQEQAIEVWIVCTGSTTV